MKTQKLNQIKPNKTGDIITEENGGNEGFMNDELVCRRELPVACERWLQAKASAFEALWRDGPSCEVRLTHESGQRQQAFKSDL